MSLKGRTVFITGASRGIGLAIAERFARDGANIAFVAKTEKAHPKLPGTVFTAAESIEKMGGKALPLVGDVRSEEQIARAIRATVEAYGGIDILINNASAISLTDTETTEMKRFDLMSQVNVRGTFLCTKLAIPHLKKASNPHILNLAPPLDMQAKWFAPHVAYTIAKFGMSLCTLGHAAELKLFGIAVNSLWPLTTIDTAAVRNVIGVGGEASRSPTIVADAAYAIVTKPAGATTGQFYIDEEVLRAEGVSDFSIYGGDTNVEFLADYFVPDKVFATLPTKVRKFYE